MTLRFDPNETRKHDLRPQPGLELDAPISRDVDVCVVMGGDGTILSALRDYAGSGVPVFAVNFGEVGFLATIDPDGLTADFDRAFRGEFETLPLPGIRVGRPDGAWLALNDISVHRKPGLRVADLAYALTGEEIGRVRCDGLVVSTPQGSTGYNLANGGPVLAWGVEGFVVSFIAPHSLTARALVVAPDDLLTINNTSREEPVELHVDGRPVTRAARGRGHPRRVRARPGCARAAAGRELLPPPAGAIRPARPLTLCQLCFRRPGPSWAADILVPVLEELRVENLLLIERAELRLGPGLTVLTGETGAGKTVLAHALDLLLGGRPRAGIVRPGASEAYVEGVFALPGELRARLGDRLADDAEELVLARRVSAEGRTRAYLGGRSATAADLRDVGAALLAFYGQHEHRKLTLASAQLEILDGFCGPSQAARRAAFAAAYAGERALAVRAGGAARPRGGARPRARPPGVGAGGRSRPPSRARRRRRSYGRAPAPAPSRGPAPGRGRRAGGARAGRRGRRGGRGAGCRRPRAGGACGASIRRWMRWPTASRRSCWRRTTSAGDLRRYGESVDAPPGRLDEVEERLALFERLKRKHGGSLAAVLAHAAACRRAAGRSWPGAEEALEAGAARLAAARAELEARAEELRAARLDAAERLSGSVREVLAGLAMEGASFAVGARRRATATGPRAATRWSSSSRRTRASRPVRCGRSRRAASCRA